MDIRRAVGRTRFVGPAFASLVLVFLCHGADRAMGHGSSPPPIPPRKPVKVEPTTAPPPPPPTTPPPTSAPPPEAPTTPPPESGPPSAAPPATTPPPRAGAPRTPRTGGPATPVPRDGPITGGGAAPTTPSGPGGPTTPGGPTGMRRGGKGTRSPNSGGEAAWETWWYFNRLGLLPDRDEARRRRVVTGDPLARVGDSGSDAVSDAGQDRAFAARRDAVPFLYSLLEPERRSRDDVKASTLLALARLSAEPRTVVTLLRRAEDPREASLVRESAALAIGLLRRTRPRDGLSAAELDAVRERLFGVFDDEKAPDRTRAFAVLALGLLGDQPFEDGFAKDGLLVVQGLWSRLARAYPAEDLPIALLTALGLQPSAGVPDGVREGLRAIVAGREVLGRRWNDFERSHTLAALARQGRPGTVGWVLRTLSRRREDTSVRRAALIALGAGADRMDATERAAAVALLRSSPDLGSDPLTAGLARIALGRVLGADLRSDDETLLDATDADEFLLREARVGGVATRGYSVLAVALAARRAPMSGRSVAVFLTEARQLLVRGLAQVSDDAGLRGACAVGLGLMDFDGASASLADVMGDEGEDPELRGHAAVALGALGRGTPEIRAAMVRVLASCRSTELRGQVALGLSFLGSRDATSLLVHELVTAGTERHLADLAVALGRLGDLAAVPPVIETASDVKRSETAQSLSVAALGLLCDPEPRPSLLRLSAESNYPARTASLHEAFSIL